jgi:hypothetical protein
MSDIKMENDRKCIIDGKLVEESPVYEVLYAEHGKEIADRWTYDRIMQSGSPELVEVVFLITGGIAPGGRQADEKIS